MPIFVNNVPTAELDTTYKMLHKYVEQYLTSGRIKSKFDFFETEELRYGEGFEINITYAADGTDTATTARLAEHGNYAPNTLNVIVKAPFERQYGVTIDEKRIARCVGNEAKLREYAGELVDSLMQGEITDKNAAVYTEINKLANVPSSVTVTQASAGEEAIAAAFLQATKAKVEDFREGVTGASYGNDSAPANKYIAAEKIAIIMSNTLASILDVYGFAKVFSPEYLQANNVERITTARAPENTIFITDGRNIQVKRVWQKDVSIMNSDGSVNEFHNVKLQVAGLFTDAGVPIFPAAKLVLGEA